MTKEEILSRVLNLLGYNKLDISEFDERLSIQKIIYLLQSSGLSLGYGYSWYIRGPYSPSLTQTVYNIAEDNSIFEKSKSLKFKNNEEIELRLQNFETKLGNKINNPNYLEILASMHYINKITFDGKGDEKRLKEKLLEAKPGLGKYPTLIDEAYRDLNKYC